MWLILLKQSRVNIKNNLLQALGSENLKNIRRQICNTIGDLAGTVYRDENDD